MKQHYQTITSIRVLPPRIRIISKEDDRDPVERYLSELDGFVQQAQPRTAYDVTHDLVSYVLASQNFEHELTSRQLAKLIEERRAMAQKHLRDIKWRLDELMPRKPLRGHGPVLPDDGSLTEVERRILDLERQERALDVALWRDTQELRTEIVKERREQEAARSRVGHLSGGLYGGT